MLTVYMAILETIKVVLLSIILIFLYETHTEE